MKLNRRNFIRQSSVLAATPLIANELWSCTPTSKTEEKSADSTGIQSGLTDASIQEFGLQLWTVKEDMILDPKSVLKSLASFGYKQVESFQSDKGIFWGMSAKDFKSYISDLGMTINSTHCNPDFTIKKETEDEFKKLVDDAASIGMKYLINPFLGSLKTQDEWKKAAEGLNRQGEICAKAGLKAGYHNHHFEFKKFADGTCPEQILLEGTNPETVDFELDLYWIVKAGENPDTWFEKYQNRFKLCHIKDLYKEEKIKEIESKEKPTDDFWPIGASTVLGTGRIDFSKVLNVAQANGVKYFIVEQERFDGTSRLDAVKADAEYMKHLKFA